MNDSEYHFELTDRDGVVHRSPSFTKWTEPKDIGAFVDLPGGLYDIWLVHDGIREGPKTIRLSALIDINVDGQSILKKRL